MENFKSSSGLLMDNRTIEYYNNHAQAFYDRTIKVDVSADYQRFLTYLRAKSHILDLGCRVGRDAKYFLENGYEVTAVDASLAMVRMAQLETKLRVMQMSFEQIAFDSVFDGVWAQASLLHVPYEVTRSVFKKSIKP